MNKIIGIQIALPWWVPPRDYYGKEVDKPYCLFTYICPDGSGFFQTIYGMN